jgi:hypothetical protein
MKPLSWACQRHLLEDRQVLAEEGIAEALAPRHLVEDAAPAAPADALHHQERSILVVAAEGVDRHHVGVLEHAGDARLAQELRRVVHPRLRLERLDGDLAIERELLSARRRSPGGGPCIGSTAVPPSNFIVAMSMPRTSHAAVSAALAAWNAASAATVSLKLKLSRTAIAGDCSRRSPLS